MFKGLSCSLDEEFIDEDEFIGDQTSLSQDVTIGVFEQNQDGEEDFNNCEEFDSFRQQEFLFFNEEYDALPVTAKFPDGRSGTCKKFTRGKGKRNFLEFNDSRDAIDYFRSTLSIQHLVSYKRIPSKASKERDFLNNLVSKGIAVETIQKYLCSGIMSRSSSKKKYIFLFNNPITPRDYVGSGVDPVFIQMIPLDQSSQTYSDELVESLLFLQENSSSSSLAIHGPSKVIGKRKFAEESLREKESVLVSGLRRSVVLSTMRDEIKELNEKYKACCLKIREKSLQNKRDKILRNPLLDDLIKKSESISESYTELEKHFSGLIEEAKEIEYGV